MTDDLDNYYKSYDYGARTPVYINESELTEKQKHQLMYIAYLAQELILLAKKLQC